MASIQQDPQSKNFRIRFRYCGRRYFRSLKTTELKVAQSILGRVEDTLRLLDQGRLEIPPKAEPGKFILSDGKINGDKPTKKDIALKELLETYQKRLPYGAKEPTTIKMETKHINNLLRLLPKRRSANSITSADLQISARRCAPPNAFCGFFWSQRLIQPPQRYGRWRRLGEGRANRPSPVLTLLHSTPRERGKSGLCLLACDAISSLNRAAFNGSLSQVFKKSSRRKLRRLGSRWSLPSPNVARLAGSRNGELVSPALQRIVGTSSAATAHGLRSRR